MKRLLSTLLAVCLCCGFVAGCGGKESGESKRKSLKAEYQTEDMEEDNALEAYNLSVPKDWKCLGGVYDSKKMYTLNDNNGYFHIECTKLRETRESLEEKISGDPTDRLYHLNFSDLKLNNQKEVDIDGQQRILYNFSGKYNLGEENGLIDGNVQYVSAIWGEGYIELSIFVNQYSSFEYNQIFEKIIESVSLDMSDEIIHEEKKELTGNLLLDAESEIIDILSETDEFIGSRILYRLSKSDVQSISQEQFFEFMNSKVSQISSVIFNYITIDFGDGTGLLIMPGSTAVVTYGEIDQTGSIINQIGVAMLEENGSYTYSQTN